MYFGGFDLRFLLGHEKKIGGKLHVRLRISSHDLLLMEVENSSTVVNIGELLAQGAEAKIYQTTFLGRPTIVKERFPKTYRIPFLDTKINVGRISTGIFLTLHFPFEIIIVNSFLLISRGKDFSSCS